MSHPIKQGLVQMISVFIDTLLLCTATAMMGLSSGIEPTAELQGAPWIQAALPGIPGKLRADLSDGVHDYVCLYDLAWQLLLL